MKTTRTEIEFARLPKDYAGLCRMLTPRPIHDKVDFENVTEITDAMAGHKLTPDQEDYFDLLCRLIEDYEKEHAQLDTSKVTALDALRHLLEANDMTAADLARLLDVHRGPGAVLLPGRALGFFQRARPGHCISPQRTTDPPIATDDDAAVVRRRSADAD